MTITRRLELKRSKEYAQFLRIKKGKFEDFYLSEFVRRKRERILSRADAFGEPLYPSRKIITAIRPPHVVAIALSKILPDISYRLMSDGMVVEHKNYKPVFNGKSNAGTDEWTKLAKANGGEYEVNVYCVNHRERRNDRCCFQKKVC